MQSSAVITRSSIIRYYMNNYRNWGKISIRCWIHKIYPIPRPNGWAFMNICQKIDRVITVPNCIYIYIYIYIFVRRTIINDSPHLPAIWCCLSSKIWCITISHASLHAMMKPFLAVICISYVEIGWCKNTLKSYSISHGKDIQWLTFIYVIKWYSYAADISLQKIWFVITNMSSILPKVVNCRFCW